MEKSSDAALGTKGLLRRQRNPFTWNGKRCERSCHERKEVNQCVWRESQRCLKIVLFMVFLY